MTNVIITRIKIFFKSLLFIFSFYIIFNTIGFILINHAVNNFFLNTVY